MDRVQKDSYKTLIVSGSKQLGSKTVGTIDESLNRHEFINYD